MLVMSNLSQLDDDHEPLTVFVPQHNDGDSEYDSAIGLDDDDSSTASPRSSVYDFPIHHGREYSAFRPDRYFAPNDEDEQDRLDTQYLAVMMATGGKLFHAPIQPKNILDLGTGTGIWAVQMGDEHRHASITGVDISPIQPELVPPGVKFEIDDVEDQWTWRENSYDLIHSGQMLSGSIRETQRYFEQAFRCCTSGGYLEVQELCMKPASDEVPVPDDAGMQIWYKHMCKGIAKYGGGGRRFHYDLSSVIALMEKVGFVEIDSRPFKIPLGQWPKNPCLKEAGIHQMAAMMSGLKGLTLAPLMEGLDWEREEVEVLLANARTDAQTQKKYYYFNMYVVWGRKPLEKDMASAALWSTVPSSTAPSSTVPSRNGTCSSCEPLLVCSDKHESGARPNLKRKRSRGEFDQT